jgi:hypothetical protein
MESTPTLGHVIITLEKNKGPTFQMGCTDLMDPRTGSQNQFQW